MLAAQLRAGGVGDALTLGQGEGAIRLPWEERGGEVRKAEEGVPGRADVWCCPALRVQARAGTCPAMTCLALLFSAKSPVIAVVDKGEQLRAEGISGSDVSKFGVYQCTCESCH